MIDTDKYEETDECEECGAVEGGNIDGCDSCNFTYWYNGKVYHPDSAIHMFEGETLGDTPTNLLAEVKRLRKDIQIAIEDIENITEEDDTQEFIEDLLCYLKEMIE